MKEDHSHLLTFLWQALGLDPAAAKLLSETAASRIAGLLPSRAQPCDAGVCCLSSHGQCCFNHTYRGGKSW